MVRWLIQHQKIRALQRQFCQCYAATLATTERSNWLEYVITREEEASQKTPSTILAQSANLANLIENCAFHIQPGMRLRIIANTHVMPNLHLSAKRLKFANQGSQQCRLAR